MPRRREVEGESESSRRAKGLEEKKVTGMGDRWMCGSKRRRER